MTMILGICYKDSVEFQFMEYPRDRIGLPYQTFTENKFVKISLRSWIEF